MSRWIRIAHADDFASASALQVDVDGYSLAIFKIEEDYFVIDNACPHAGYTLHDGYLEGQTVSCALHGAEFDLTTGVCTGGIKCSDIPVYPARLSKDGGVLVELD